MSLKQKIYLSLIGLLSFGFLVLLIIGITHSHESTKKLSSTQEQDHQLKTQIDENSKILTEISTKIKTLQTELTNNPQLDPTIKTQKQQELTELKNQQQKQQTLVNNLIEQRKALNQNQQEKKAALEKLAQEKAQLQTQENLQQQISQFQQAINYVAANQKNLEELKNRKENRENQTELKNLNGFNLFLEGQKLYFNKQKNNLQTQLNHLKENKPLPHTKKQVTFKDVYGMETEKEELEDLLTYFKTNQTLINFDQVRPKGYLLYGPPGTGKTFLIKALCGEANVHFINLIPAKFRQKYIGEGEKEVEKVWQEAESHDKTIIFIDEIEGLENRNDSNISSGGVNVINTLLDKLDGFNSSNKKIVLMGATNNLHKIDTALRSRFSKEIYIGHLKDSEIEGYLKHIITPYQISYHTFLALKEITQLCQGKNLSNRDLTTIIEEAYKKTAKWSQQNPQTHAVMLPSDIEEVLNLKLKIKPDRQQVKKRREACENQYAQWREGILQYLDKPKDETKVERLYTFDGLNGIDYYVRQCSGIKSELEQIQTKLTKIHQENKIAQLEQELITLNQTPEKYEQTIKDKNQEINYIKNELKILPAREEELRKELKLIENRRETQKEPTNLASYIKDRHPFDRWNKDGDTYNYTTLNGFNSAHFYNKDDSYLDNYVNFEKHEHKGPGYNKLILKYKGPKHFLEDDKDYYLGRAFVLNSDFELTNFHLHFNPVRKTLSLYQDKHNYDKVKRLKMEKINLDGHKNINFKFQE
ncbi:AAA family ATPase ['Santalum album' aster yellows phytoplasma]|uniref:AAA family ATPase n=1 Tax='Santalum album' aster yellows phytoplasma TaxID=2831467 RepID=A0ABS5LK93_9MOLU|nr:AAA family ATPase ['Santalum album' aster yellows phytoplasma]MBS2993807.1 AAA family ATPase ['Santalum album' aster yellows phytoplasma]